MRIPLLTVLIGLVSLAACLAQAVQPVAASPQTPVELDPSCAVRLATRLTLGNGGPVRVLGCDPAGRGRAVVAIGDPATAADIAVLVPGADIDLATLEDPVAPQRRPWGWAQALSEAAGPGTAVVLWVGYETPQGLGRDAAGGRPARAAVPALVGDVAALRSRAGAPPAHVTVIGHSYGAVVVTLAAAQLAADDLVLLASPGARATDVAGLHTSARVSAARGPDDWIRWVPHLSIGDLGHGADPAAASFGADLLPADDVVGHAGYFRPGSTMLAALAGVVTGPPHRVPA
jgi:hypothetical protein